MAAARASAAPRPPARIARITALTPEDTTAGLYWLAMNFPAVCDAMLDKAECYATDDPDPGHEPEPYCALCGFDIGIFLKLGLEWRHYTGDPTTLSHIELTDPGHEPVVAWRQILLPAAAHLAPAVA
jgi:hypothetical protein